MQHPDSRRSPVFCNLKNYSIALGLIAALATGCTAPHAPSSKAATHQPSAAPPAPVQLLDGDEKDLADWVAKQRGKVVLVDYWATWCGECKKQFPHTVDLHRRFASQGLAVATVACNDAEDRAKALEFLRSQQASFYNLLWPYGFSDKGLEAFGIHTGALPYYILYDRQGKRRDDLGTGTRMKGIKPEELEEGVEKLLAEGK